MEHSHKKASLHSPSGGSPPTSLPACHRWPAACLIRGDIRPCRHTSAGPSRERANAALRPPPGGRKRRRTLGNAKQVLVTRNKKLRVDDLNEVDDSVKASTKKPKLITQRLCFQYVSNVRFHVTSSHEIFVKKNFTFTTKFCSTPILKQNVLFFDNSGDSETVLKKQILSGSAVQQALRLQFDEVQPSTLQQQVQPSSQRVFFFFFGRGQSELCSQWPFETSTPLETAVQHYFTFVPILKLTELPKFPSIERRGNATGSSCVIHAECKQNGAVISKRFNYLTSTRLKITLYEEMVDTTTTPTLITRIRARANKGLVAALH
ncbi:unnamed protein product [Trichogramma brassicae]|uniref:Uncharacterized protein n=1 Tax=Trichogramma brassicae TaxID=86971 RepID=A0A6H5IWG3_9HYME|nr:unnamed protein product [Trichogramma brassicae]